MRLLVTIPCLNEAETIGQVIKLIPKTLDGISKIDTVIIDDGSKDETSSVAKKIGANVIKHHKNFGVGRAFQTAVNYAVQNEYDLMVSIDGDGQFNANNIKSLVKPLVEDQVDLVTGSRFINKEKIPNMPRIKLIGNKLMAYLISKLVGQTFHDVSCGFRSYSRKALLELNLHGDFTYTQETFLNCAVKKMSIVELPVTVKYFKDRKSRIAGSILKYMFNTLKIILRSYRDYFPLRFFWSISLFFFIPGFIFGAIFLGHYIVNGVFTGFLFAGFLSAFFLVLTVIFLIVGILADMLDRIRSNQERILYLLKKSKR